MMISYIREIGLLREPLIESGHDQRAGKNRRFEARNEVNSQLLTSLSTKKRRFLTSDDMFMIQSEVP